MAVFDELRRASYKSVPFFVTSANTPAGIKHVKHVYPNSSNQSIEELGLLQRTYNVSAILTSNANGSGYFSNRDRLLRALEAGGIGTLIHPFYGRLPSLKAVSWAPNETMVAVGEYVVDIVFEVHKEQDVPVSAGFSFSQVFQDVTDFISAVTTDIESNYGVVNSFVSSISDGISQVEQFGDAVVGNINIAAQLPDQITGIADQVIELFDTSATIATTPSLLASTTTDIFDNVDDLYSDPVVTLEVLKRFFAFGDDDVPINTDPDTTTVVLTQRNDNRNLYRSTVQGLALSYAYLNASRIDFTTVEAIEAEETELEAQYDKVAAAPGFTEQTKAALTDLRIITSDFFAEQKLTTDQIITVRTNTTSTRLLAYQYYGASVENAPIIQDLNSITDNTFISGDVEIITA